MTNCKSLCRVFTMLLVLVFAHLHEPTCSAADYEPSYRPGWISFSASFDIVSIPGGVNCIYFDTLECSG